LIGYAEHRAQDGSETAVAVLQQFVRNQGDAWSFTLATLRRELDTLALVPEDTAPDLDEVFSTYLRYAELLGQRTAELHLALATPTDDPAFAAEPLGREDVAAAATDARAMAERAFAALGRLGRGGSEEAREAVAALVARREACFSLIDELARTPPGGVKTRIHGDYHLGQVLIVQDDVMIVDFEGEPSRPAEERRAKGSPLRDVAGMLRSFAYAAATAAEEVAARFAENEADRVRRAAAQWEAMASQTFLGEYEATIQGRAIWVEDERGREGVLRLHLLGKALYEINYEANNRPDWIAIPVRGVLDILDQSGTSA
jgi:maltose alpha-D-glucosyltransferase/alpha-amylase